MEVRIVFALNLISLFCFSQNDFNRKGGIKSMLTISSGKSLELESSNFYLHGNLEFFVQENLSISGEGFYSTPNNVSYGERSFEFSHSLFFGQIII